MSKSFSFATAVGVKALKSPVYVIAIFKVL
jgi:hypothetical protein